MDSIGLPVPEKPGFQTSELSTVAAADGDAQQRVLTVMRHRQDVVRAGGLKDYIAAGGIKVLTHIIIKDWPADGDFSASESPSDVVVRLAPDLDPVLLGYGPASGQVLRALKGRATSLTRSLRRVALDTLADMTAAQPRVMATVLQKLDLFRVPQLPLMLSNTMKRYIPGMTWTDQVEHPDQGQQIAERLLHVLAQVAWGSDDVATFLAQYCTVVVCKYFIDPWQAKWEPQHKARALKMAAASARRSSSSGGGGGGGGGSSSRIWPDVRPPPELMTTAKRKEVTCNLQWEGSRDEMTATFARYMLIVVQIATSAERLSFVEEGDANIKVDRVVDHPVVGESNSPKLRMVADLLQTAWCDQACVLSRSLAQSRKSGVGAQALSLRQAGNEEFKAGKYRPALKQYLAALELTPEDPLIYCNISLVHLRLDNINEAFDTARSAVAHDATSAKAWVRLGDACGAGNRWQLAQLCYQAALSISPADQDVQARRVAACAQLSSVWDWDPIPPFWDKLSVGKWLDLPCQGQLNSSAAQTAWINKIDKEITKLSHTSRVIATELKQHILTSKAMHHAQIGEIARLPAVHQWQMCWSDSPFRGPVTGIVKYMLTLADAEESTTNPNTSYPPLIVEGKPGLTDTIQAIAHACFHPPNSVGRPNKPTSLSLGHRMLDIYDDLRAALEPWGIHLTIETRVEAERSSVQYKTDPDGINYGNDMGYSKLKVFNLTSREPDKRNDHAPAAAATSKSSGSSSTSAGTATTSAAAGASSSSGGGAAAADATGDKQDKLEGSSKKGKGGSGKKNKSSASTAASSSTATAATTISASTRSSDASSSTPQRSPQQQQQDKKFDKPFVRKVCTMAPVLSERQLCINLVSAHGYPRISPEGGELEGAVLGQPFYDSSGLQILRPDKTRHVEQLDLGGPQCMDGSSPSSGGAGLSWQVLMEAVSRGQAGTAELKALAAMHAAPPSSKIIMMP